MSSRTLPLLATPAPPIEQISRKKAGILWRLGGVTDRELVRRFLLWSSQALWLWFAKDTPEGAVFSRSLAAKRGNEVYSFNLRRRISQVTDRVGSLLRVHRSSTNAVFVTLTYRPEGSRGAAWLDLGASWNLFVANLRKRYGAVEFVRSWESHRSGWPHVHALIIFKDHDFKTQLRWSWRRRKMISRVEGASLIKGYWKHGHVDVEGCETTKGAVFYITKEVLKYGADLSPLQNQKTALTQAICWALGRRSFAISRGLHEDPEGRLDASPRVSLTQTGWIFMGIADVRPDELKNPWVQRMDYLPEGLRRPRRRGEIFKLDGEQHELLAGGRILNPAIPGSLDEFADREPIYDELPERIRCWHYYTRASWKNGSWELSDAMRP